MTLEQAKKEGRVRLYFTFGVITILLGLILLVMSFIEDKRIKKTDGKVAMFYTEEETKYPMVSYVYDEKTYVSVLRDLSADDIEADDEVSFYIDVKYPGKAKYKFMGLGPVAIILMVCGVCVCVLTRKGTKDYYEKFFKRYMGTYIFTMLTIVVLVVVAIRARYDDQSILMGFSYNNMRLISILLMSFLLVDVVIGMAVQNKYEKAHLSDFIKKGDSKQ